MGVDALGCGAARRAQGDALSIIPKVTESVLLCIVGCVVCGRRYYERMGSCEERMVFMHLSYFQHIQPTFAVRDEHIEWYDQCNE